MLDKLKEIKSSLNLPSVTADAWCIYDVDCGGCIVAGKNCDRKKEVASLTKMMTFYVSWNLFQKFFPESTNIEITIKKECTKVTGTKAKLKAGDKLDLVQLYYGLLLPSGNDAGLVLADYFGTLLGQKKKTEPSKSS
jgi:serine-type D-Ala-D-Ala carboxypeptidase (penicillin-binding protein 5/6)